MQRLENAPFTLQYTFRQYDGCEPVAEVSRRMTVVSSFADEVDFGGARWRVELAWCATPQDADGLVCEVQVTALGGDADNVSFAVEAVWEDWSTGHYVMLPAAVYAGNRFKGRRIVYPPVPEDAANMGPDAPPLISDIPRLNIGPGPSRIQLTAGEMATPAICIRDPNRNLGFVWLTHQQTAKGDAGFRIAESEDRTRAVVSLMAPMVREESVYGNTRMDNPSDDCGADFHSGDCLEFAFHLHCFAAEDIPALFARFFALRKTMTGPTAYVHQIPWSAAFRIQEDEYNARRWNDEFGHYAVGLMQGRYDDWQIGWVGGMMATYPMLFQGNALSRERARRNFDFACTTQAEAGFFWPVHSNGRCIGDYFRKDDGGNWLLVRRMGDALYFWCKQLALLEAQGASVKPEWRKAPRRLAEALVNVWNKHGQLGQFVDLHTGDVLLGGSTSGAIVPAGLALAADAFDAPQYIETAQAIASRYYRDFVLRGYTSGGPGEALQAPDSESAFGLLESFVMLYEATDDIRWRDYAEAMAHQCATWCVSYDFAFPPESEFARLGMRTTGTVWANAQNKHSAPGICTLSGDSLFKLFRATGDRRYIELLRDIAHNLTQYMSRADRPIRTRLGLPGDRDAAPVHPPGYINERVNTGDWEGKTNVGEIFFGPCWPEVTHLLTAVEVPGLYIQHDTGFLWAFDHIDAELIGGGDEELVVHVTNPTPFDANVRLFVESSADAKRPLGQNALRDRPLFHVAAGAAVVLLVNRRDGAVSFK